MIGNSKNIIAAKDWPFWPSAEAAAQELGTPLYVYLPREAQNAYLSILNGVQLWGSRIKLAYSLKTNPYYALLGDLRSWGSSIEVVSDWEYDLARNAGFLPEDIVFNGPLKTGPILRHIANKRLFTINIDSSEELEAFETFDNFYGTPVDVGLRVCPPRADTAWSRFGLQIENGEFESCLRRVEANPRLFLKSVQIHLGTQIEPIEKYFRTLEFANELWTKFDFGPEVWLDLGGGFPYCHDLTLESQKFDPKEFFSNLGVRWASTNRPPLIVEPGRWIAAPAFAIVSRVVASKSRIGEPTIVVLDSGTNQNVMAAFYNHRWAMEETCDKEGEYRFCGPLCMEDDVLSGPLRGSMPKQDSLVVTLNAGAYSLSLSRTFIQPRPPIVSVNEDGLYEVMVQRECIDNTYGISKQSAAICHDVHNIEWEGCK